MGWDRKHNGRRYLYRSYRVEGHVAKEYQGLGRRAAEATRQLDARCQARQAARDAWLPEQARAAGARKPPARRGEPNQEAP
jgi:hypothetical protein